MNPWALIGVFDPMHHGINGFTRLPNGNRHWPGATGQIDVNGAVLKALELLERQQGILIGHLKVVVAGQADIMRLQWTDRLEDLGNVVLVLDGGQKRHVLGP